MAEGSIGLSEQKRFINRPTFPRILTVTKQQPSLMETTRAVDIHALCSWNQTTTLSVHMPRYSHVLTIYSKQ